MWVSYRESHEQTTQLVQVIVPETKRYQLPEAENALVYPMGDHEYHDPIMHMVHSALEESQDDNPVNSIIIQMRLNISPPEEYSGSSDLKVYETFITGILQWLRLLSEDTPSHTSAVLDSTLPLCWNSAPLPFPNSALPSSWGSIPLSLPELLWMWNSLHTYTQGQLEVCIVQGQCALSNDPEHSWV